MLYDWIIELTGIITGSSSGYSQNSNVQAAACIIVLMVVFYFLFLLHHIIQRFFHLH